MANLQTLKRFGIWTYDRSSALKMCFTLQRLTGQTEPRTVR